MEFAITQSFFEIQTPDFAWKFILTVPSKWACMQRKFDMESMQKNPWTMELAITQTFFELQTQDFACKFV